VRILILDRVRRIALVALWRQDLKTWDRAADILTREGRRIHASYASRKHEVAHAN
jgi:hypothetical protein